MRVGKLFVLPLTIIALTCGCGTESSGPDTYPVTGTVTLDGTPLATGSIVFDPVNGTGQGCAGTITDGQYEMESCAGNMRVSITSTTQTGEVDEYGESVHKSVLPRDKYDLNSKLTADVTADGANTFNFELTSGAN
jgi:hypothetical protein